MSTSRTCDCTCTWHAHATPPGLEFFCTTIESPDGDIELLRLAMEAMNAQPKPDDEERKGCSGHVGKMIFSAGADQLALVAYVPADKAAKIDVTEWMTVSQSSSAHAHSTWHMHMHMTPAHAHAHAHATHRVDDGE